MNVLSTCIFVVTSLSAFAAILLKESIRESEDAVLNFTELGIKYGYPVEEYDVVTKDGYILKLFHISGKRKGSILLLHGILDSADAFIIRGKLSLAITLADAGYDIWAGNTRGNKYSRRHEYLDPDIGPKFWDFSFHEVGYYDLAATIDFILDFTGEMDLRTIAHSQGTTAHFVLLSTRPEYNKKIKGFIGLAPVAFVSNLVPPVSTATKFGPEINQFLKSLGMDELLGDQSKVSELARLLCSQGIIGYDLCNVLAMSPFLGLDPKRVEPSFWKVVLGHYPAGTSRKSLMHYFQLAESKRFAYYDYGLSKNLRRYKLLVPPSYNLHKVMTNVSLIVSQNDALSTVKDVDILRSLLPNEPKYHLMTPTVWNHVDFVWANDMDVYLYPYVLSYLKDFE